MHKKVKGLCDINSHTLSKPKQVLSKKDILPSILWGVFIFNTAIKVITRIVYNENRVPLLIDKRLCVSFQHKDILLTNWIKVDYLSKKLFHKWNLNIWSIICHWFFEIQKSWLQNSINGINEHDFANFNYLPMINFREMLLIERLRIISSKTTMPQRQSSKNNLKEIKKLDIILNKLLIYKNIWLLLLFNVVT